MTKEQKIALIRQIALDVAQALQLLDDTQDPLWWADIATELQRAADVAQEIAVSLESAS